MTSHRPFRNPWSTGPCRRRPTARDETRSGTASSAALIQLGKSLLHLLKVLICLHVLVGVAELGLQPVLVLLQVDLQLVQLLLLLCRKRGGALLLGLLFLALN